MSDKSSTFAPEIEKEDMNILRRKRNRQCWGATGKGYGGVKNILRARRRKERTFFDFGVRSFHFPWVT